MARGTDEVHLQPLRVRVSTSAEVAHCASTQRERVISNHDCLDPVTAELHAVWFLSSGASSPDLRGAKPRYFRRAQSVDLIWARLALVTTLMIARDTTQLHKRRQRIALADWLACCHGDSDTFAAQTARKPAAPSKHCR